MIETNIDISLVIPTKGRADAIGNALTSISLQSVNVREVVIVDGSPQSMKDHFSDNVFGDCPNNPCIIYCHAPEDHGLTAARNRGIRASSGSLVQFLDDDAVLDPEYFRRLLPVFDSPDVGGASGHVIEPTRKVSALKRVFFRFFYIWSFRQIREETFLRPGIGPKRSNILPGVGIYRREVFDSFLFDENLTGPCSGEDVEFSYRVGKIWKLMIEPSAKVYHYPSPSERLSTRRNFANKVTFYYYHFHKNIDKTLLAWIAYIWLNIGFVLHSLTTMRGSAVWGVCDGLWSILHESSNRKISPGI